MLSIECMAVNASEHCHASSHWPIAFTRHMIHLDTPTLALSGLNGGGECVCNRVRQDRNPLFVCLHRRRHPHHVEYIVCSRSDSYYFGSVCLYVWYVKNLQHNFLMQTNRTCVNHVQHGKS